MTVKLPSLLLPSLMTAVVALSGCGGSEKSDTLVINKDAKPYRGTLKRIKREGVLRVIVPDKEFAGLPREGEVLTFEMDMARELAAGLGVELALVYAHRYDSIIPWLVGGKGDVAMAMLTATEKRKEKVDFSKPLGHVKEMLIGRAGDTAEIDEVSDLENHTVVVRPSSSYYGTLKRLKEEVPGLKIAPAPERLHTHEIIHKVAQGAYPLTLADTDIARAVNGYEERIAVLLPVSGYRPRGWAVAKGCDSLRARLNAFILEQSLGRSRRERFTGDLEGIKERRCLRVATRNNAATYWIHRGKEVGFEYELCRAFARKHDLRLHMVIAPERGDLLKWVKEGRADLAAACITVTDKRKKKVAFGAPYLFPVEVVVCRTDSAGDPEIGSKEDLAGRTVHVRKSSSYYGTLLRLRNDLGVNVAIRAVPEDMETEEVIERVAKGDYDLTVSDDYLARMAQLYCDSIAIGPALTDARTIGWAMRPNATELKAAVDGFFTKGSYKPKGLHYNILYRRYFKSERRVAMARSEQRADLHGQISPYDNLIQRYARTRDFDWRMVAAQAYQESQFDLRAKSWAGAMGLMQIMPLTARELGVSQPFDPGQNVAGGTKYMRQLIERFDEGIPYRERYHLALASYNAGYGHVADARRLAEEMHWDPDVWLGNVEKAMLLLAKPKYARAARYGYVRGSEPVTYVSTIQRLYDHYSQID